MRQFLLLLPLLIGSAYGQQVAITIDDFPFRRMGLPEQEEAEMINKLYAHLEAYGVKVTGFLNAGRLTDANEQGVQNFLSQGHDMGNHTSRHSSIDQVGSKRFIEDVEKGMEEGKDFINTHYFRYPYLRRGSTLERRDSVYAYLEKNGYSIAHVSIDNNEWIYNRDYASARKKGDQMAMDSIAAAYMDHMKQVSLDYEKDSQALLGRSIRHILLVHANPINAYHLGQLLQWYQDQGWEFISLEAALEDPVYAMEGDFVSPIGLSILDKLKQMAKDQASAPTDR